MNENIADVNKIDLENLPESEINQLPASTIIDNIENAYSLKKLSNEDKIVECISFIQDPKNNFSNYNEDKRKSILLYIFYCCENTKNIYEKLSVEQIIGFQKMLQDYALSNDIHNVFKDMIKHAYNGNNLEDKILAIVDVINNDSSLPFDLPSNFLNILPELKQLYERNKFSLDPNYIFDKISLEKFFEHNYFLGFSGLYLKYSNPKYLNQEEPPLLKIEWNLGLDLNLKPELIEKLLNSCHNSKESGLNLTNSSLFRVYTDKYGYEDAKNKLLKFVEKINNQQNMPKEVVNRFSININLLPREFEPIKNEIYEKFSTDKFFQYKNEINFRNILPYLSEEKINQILEIFHKSNENNDAFAKDYVFWDKYVNKFGKEALKEKFLEITNDINNGNISSDIANSFLLSLHRYYRRNPELGIKEIIDKISVDKIVQYVIVDAIEYLDEEKLDKLIDFCHDSKNFDFLFKSEKLLSNYINKFANEPNAIEDLLSDANHRLENKIFYSSIKNNIFNLPPDKIFEIFSDTNEIKNAILSNLDKINENNKSNIVPLLEKYVEKQNLSDKNKEITSAFIDSFENAPPSSEQILPQLKNFFEFVEHPIQENQQEKQTIKPIDKTKTKSIFSFKNKNKQEPKQEQQEK